MSQDPDDIYDFLRSAFKEGDTLLLSAVDVAEKEVLALRGKLAGQEGIRAAIYRDYVKARDAERQAAEERDHAVETARRLVNAELRARDLENVLRSLISQRHIKQAKAAGELLRWLEEHREPAPAVPVGADEEESE